MEGTNVASILTQLKSLEAQIAALRIQVEHLIEQEQPRPTVADFFGRLERQMNTSEEEIASALYRITPEFEEEIATIPRDPLP